MCQDEIIVEINQSNGNSDVELDTNGDSLQDDDEEEEEENSEQKLIMPCNNNEPSALTIISGNKSLHNGVGVNGISSSVNQMGW